MLLFLNCAECADYFTVPLEGINETFIMEAAESSGYQCINSEFYCSNCLNDENKSYKILHKEACEEIEKLKDKVAQLSINLKTSKSYTDRLEFENKQVKIENCSLWDRVNNKVTPKKSWWRFWK